MSEQITYAKVGGPPDDWCGLRVFDRDSGAEVLDVLEANAAEGWLIRLARDEAGEFYAVGQGGDAEAAVERLEGRFEIRRPS